MKPIIYLYFHAKILDWKGKEMSEKEFKSCFFQWRIPKNLREPLMKEMQKVGLIKIEKKKVFIQDFYIEKNFGILNNEEEIDQDTRKGSPYLSFQEL